MQTTEVKIRLRMNNQVIYEHEIKIKLKKVINYKMSAVTNLRVYYTYNRFSINQSLKVYKMYVKKKKHNHRCNKWYKFYDCILRNLVEYDRVQMKD